MNSKTYKLNVPISSSHKQSQIIKKLSLFLDNPWDIKIKTKLPKRRNSIINLPQDIYLRLKLLYPNYPICATIYSIFGIKEDELFYGSLLFKPEEGWEREKYIPDVGRIDGFNYFMNKIVELKFVNGWTHALGQILAYSRAYPNMKLELWLLVDKTVKISRKKKIISTCNFYGVSVSFLDINDILD